MTTLKEWRAKKKDERGRGGGQAEIERGRLSPS